MRSYDTRSDESISAETTQVSHEALNTESQLTTSDHVADAFSEVTEIEAESTGEQSVSPEGDTVATVERIYAEEPGRIPDGQRPPRRASSRFSRGQFVTWLPFWAVIALGAVLRFWDLGAKPLHHDESLHAYYSLGLLHNLQNWGWCVGLNNPPAGYTCYQYNPLLHGPFQFHAIALVYQISAWLGAPDHGINTTTVRIAAALLGTVLVGLPYFLRDYMGKVGALLACLFLAVSPSMVYFSRFAREDIYMACFTLLLVVAIGRYIRERKMGWLVLASAGFALSYATSEATFLTIAVFGSFLGALIVWELGSRFSRREPLTNRGVARILPRTAAPLIVLAYFLLIGIAAKVALAQLNQLSSYIIANQSVTDVALLNLESFTVRLIPWLGIILGLFVFGILLREIYGKLPEPGSRRGLARLVDRRQPVLDTLLTMPWTHWFFALILAFGIFLVLFSVLFTNIAGGIGDGIWRGLYYWLEQQQVQRGGQPWYYYLLLIPLYEQVGVVFGIVGLVRCLRKPNPFRLFLVYWFLGDFFLYSWAGEKMPWLVVFMTMPLMLLAAIGLEPSVLACYRFARARFFAPPAEERPFETYLRRRDAGVGRVALGLFGVVMAALLLLPTLHNMVEVSYVEPASAPHEMMIYVQTTTDVNAIMAQIDAVDQKDFGGKHQMRIGVTADATWPFAWYLRDYPNLCFSFPANCPSWKDTVPVILAANDVGDPTVDINAYAPAGKDYLYHVYNMRSWWDEGYKLPACEPTQKPSLSCSDPRLGSGVGPLLWLSYGDNPPPGASFNLGRAAQRIWNWWWYRQPFGSTDGAYSMELFIQKGMGVKP